MWISKVAIILDVNLRTLCDSIPYAICRTVTNQTVLPPQEWVSCCWGLLDVLVVKCILREAAKVDIFFSDWIPFHYCSMLNTIIREELVLCVRCAKNRGVCIILLLNLMIQHSFQFNSIFNPTSHMFGSGHVKRDIAVYLT